MCGNQGKELNISLDKEGKGRFLKTKGNSSKMERPFHWQIKCSCKINVGVVALIISRTKNHSVGMQLQCILKVSEEMFDAHMLVNLVQFSGIIVTYTVSLSYI